MKENMSLKMYISRLESELTIQEVEKKNTQQLLSRFENEINEMRKERTTLHAYQIKYKLESQDNLMTTLTEIRNENKKLQDDQLTLASNYKKSRKYIRKLLYVIHLYEGTFYFLYAYHYYYYHYQYYYRYYRQTFT